MNNGKIVFAQSGNKRIAVHVDSFVNATFRPNRDTEALVFNQGTIGTIRRQTTMDMPEASDTWHALKQAAQEPGSQLVYLETENIINMGKVLTAIFDPNNPNEKYDLRVELFGFAYLCAGEEAASFWRAMEAYAQLELA